MTARSHINVFYSDEDRGFIAEVPDLDGVSAFGETPSEAVAEIEQVIELWIDAATEAGRPIPEPRSSRPLSS
jgi:predicted RNase H-like HicB family nuclease